MNWKATAFILAALITIGFVMQLNPASATPLYAIRSVNRCNTCHVEPVDWANPAMKDRKCTLDCAICHVSPQGGGMRNASGLFYGREVLPRWGKRPSVHATSDDDATTSGYYRLGKGFSGWEAGNTLSTDVPDRYGNINPIPKFRAGGDIRIMAYLPAEKGTDKYTLDPALFPMQAQLYLMGRPHENIVLYGDVGLMSPLENTNIFGLDIGGAGPLNYLRVRELYVMADNLPYRGYVRAGRLNNGYGWRIPDHTALIRRPLGLDQNRQVFGIEGGINPNYPFVNASVFAQGPQRANGDNIWPGDTGDTGWGVNLNGGIRELGWHASGSLQYTSTEAGDSLMFGPQWAVNLYPVSIIGEIDFRQNFTSNTSTLAGYSEFNWLMSWGITGHLKLEYLDPDLSRKDDHQNRIAIGTNFHPWTHVDLMLEYRQTYTGGTALFLGSELSKHELLFITHTWF